MKKPDRELLLHFDRLAKRRYRRNLVEASQERRKAALRRRAKPRQYSGKTLKVRAPIQFHLARSPAREDLLNCIERIKFLLHQGANVHIVFDDTTNLFPCGTLLFVATIQELIEKFPDRLSCNYPVDPVVEQLFQHIGILQQLGNGPRLEITAENVKYWHLIDGTTTDVTAFKKLFSVFRSQLTKDTEAGLFEGMSEAVTNIVQHAYPERDQFHANARSRWWMFAQKQDTKLSVAICDLGIGIPNSLREKPELANILPTLLRRLRKRVATGLIEIAVESSRSRTKLVHRGKGLPDMFAFVKRGEIGGFSIYSLNGAFQYNAALHVESGRDLDNSIDGTLIQWTLDLLPTRQNYANN